MLTNCSFLNNSALRGGAIASKGPYVSPMLTNCVLFGNGGRHSMATAGSVRYSLYETGVLYNGPGNIITSVSPFVNATDARLNACAPAINAGDNAADNSTTDLAGNPRRYNGGQIDMGAYEYQGQPNFPTSITQQPVSGSSVCAGSPVLVAVAVSGLPVGVLLLRASTDRQGQTVKVLHE